MDKKSVGTYFSFFNEVAIIEQLSRAMLEARLPNGLIAPHFTVLNHLTRLGDGKTPLDMARAFQVPKTSMTHTLSGLERHGLIEMRPHPKDGRSKQVWLTEEGRKVRERTIDALGPDFQKIAARFPVEQIENGLPLLESVRAYLDKMRDT
ncbi:MarR family winged helix-turn-helix transcriptional regulator [Litoreibacter roseus]|uniref:HTH marR-type domain-containing protein n=1 Tax=Litoreibacter roseus TaxID=2601869 RepID=A0A6N6JA50_9RHOB|nr:MarR family transcriptional regulator [Litoreibacter roseus]GFE63111.1 hypothetical protein KIN_01850 [Litoreibacter roseus]